ncbi:hypothetical protein VTP01DRAFT_9849 [Rhizomucor pusillus]|uniref:uncharacterized protein n=1 Tax=Rhizomucor pusillus TaxID=4840 RepID=UPI003742E810
MSETFHGYIASTKDSLIVFEACRRGLLPRVTRRLQEQERHLVQSGAVFCFDENESGIKRWTDGLVWSPSRILGNFLVYRELDKRANPIDGYGDNTSGLQNLSDRQRERALVGSLTDSYRFKKDGLIKKSMSLVVDGVQQHLVSYYRKNDVLEDKLRRPSTVPVLALLDISPDLIFGQNFRIPVHVDGKTLTSRYSPSFLTREENIAAILDRSVIRQRRKQAARTKQLELQQQQQKNLFQLSSDTTTTTATECICGANQAGSSSSSSSTTATISSSSPSTNNPFNTSSIPSTTVVHHQAVTAIPPALEYNNHSAGSSSCSSSSPSLSSSSSSSSSSFGVGSSAYAMYGPAGAISGYHLDRQEQNPHQHLFSSTSLHHINHAAMPLQTTVITNAFMYDPNCLLGYGWNDYELQM